MENKYVARAEVQRHAPVELLYIPGVHAEHTDAPAKRQDKLHETLQRKPNSEVRYIMLSNIKDATLFLQARVIVLSVDGATKLCNKIA